MSALRPDLLDAYLRAEYRAEIPSGPITIRIGKNLPALDSLLSESDLDSWAFLTADNPRSIRSSTEENLLSFSSLKRRVQELGYQFWIGEGVDPDGRWPNEQSLLIVGITREESRDLARDYQQNAFVFGFKSQPAILEVLN